MSLGERYASIPVSMDPIPLNPQTAATSTGPRHEHADQGSAAHEVPPADIAGSDPEDSERSGLKWYQKRGQSRKQRTSQKKKSPPRTQRRTNRIDTLSCCTVPFLNLEHSMTMDYCGRPDVEIQLPFPTPIIRGRLSAFYDHTTEAAVIKQLSELVFSTFRNFAEQHPEIEVRPL